MGSEDVYKRKGLVESIVDADVIVLAVPWSATEHSIMVLGDLSDRVIIDATNPFVKGLNLEIGHTDSGGERVAAWAEDARVVKALNIVEARYVSYTHLTLPTNKQ